MADSKAVNSNTMAKNTFPIATSTNQANRINKNTVQKYRLKLQGAERSLASIIEKLEVIDKEFAKKSITSTRRKSLQSQRVKLLEKQDDARIEMQLAKQRMNFYLSHNMKISSRERLQNRRNGSFRLRVEKLTFTFQSFYKTKDLSPASKEILIGAVMKNDNTALHQFLSQAITDNSQLRVTLPEDGTPESTAFINVMMKWFQGRYKIGSQKAHINNNSVADAAR